VAAVLLLERRDVDKISRERLEAPPGAVYTETILAPGYAFMLEHYFYPLVETNKAWTVMLAETSIIDAATAAALLRAIFDLETEGPEGMGPFDPNYEYFYSHMERYLTNRAGEEVAGEINIGRTRPEPLTRMVVRERLLRTLVELGKLRATLLDIAEREAETVMPQWTHLQHAQLSTVGHYLVGIARSLERDHVRMTAAYRTVNQCTLGCGALAGSSYPLDRQLVSDLLGFDGFRENSIDCVSSSDFTLESSAALANMMITLSRLCQDLYVWSSEEFGLLEIGDDYAGSSSMMPQKKNAYPFEYVRARAAHAVGEMTSAYGTLHNTNYQDIKDVEEEVVYPVFRSFDEASRSLKLLDGTISSVEFDRDAMVEKAAEGYGSCTELAARIHRQTDISYRTAHKIVGNLVLRAYKQGKAATEVDADMVNESAREIIGRDLDVDDQLVKRSLDPTAFVRAHDVPGGPAPQRVADAIAGARDRLADDVEELLERREALDRAAAELDERARRLVEEG
jgi:argininosuccinate lyase